MSVNNLVQEVQAMIDSEKEVRRKARNKKKAVRRKRRNKR